MSANVIALLPKKRGRQAGDGRERFSMYPRGLGGRYFVYAVGFKGGVVKIGMTGNPRQRLTQHWLSAKGDVDWVHLFERGSKQYARMVEARAADALASIARQINRSEWFYADDKRAVIAAMRSVIATSKVEVAKWARQTEASAARHRRAMQLLAAAEAAEQRPHVAAVLRERATDPTEPAEARDAA